LTLSGDASNFNAMSNRLVTLWRYRDLTEAQIALSKLESAGITCDLADDEMVRLGWTNSNFIGGVRLQVAEDEADEALRILQEPAPDEYTPEEVGSRYVQPRCPRCDSLDILSPSFNKPLAYLTLFMLKIPVKVRETEMKCEERGYRWQASSDLVRQEGQTDTTLYVATSNSGKLREFRRAAESVPVVIDELPTLTQIEPPAETGQTFEENARIKAEAYSRTLPAHLVFADDSGLEVKALNGEPGVYSARYAATEDSPDPSDDENNYKLIYELSQRPDAERTARFVCVIAIAKDGETLGTFRGSVEGEILQAPLGKGGFGYDPLFLIPSLNKTMAELNEEEKFAISHRGNAFRALLRWLEEKGLVSPSSL